MLSVSQYQDLINKKLEKRLEIKYLKIEKKENSVVASFEFREIYQAEKYSKQVLDFPLKEQNNVISMIIIRHIKTECCE